MYKIKIIEMNRISRFEENIIDLGADTQMDRVAECKQTSTGCFME